MLLEEIANQPYTILIEMSGQDLSLVQRFVSNLFADLGLRVRFMDHVKDRVVNLGDPERNIGRDDLARETSVTAKELAGAFSALKNQYKDKLLHVKKNSKEFIGVLRDAATKLNLPFVIDSRRNEMRVMTIMRKANFGSDHAGGEQLMVNSGTASNGATR